MEVLFSFKGLVLFWPNPDKVIQRSPELFSPFCIHLQPDINLQLFFDLFYLFLEMINHDVVVDLVGFLDYLYCS